MVPSAQADATDKSGAQDAREPQAGMPALPFQRSLVVFRTGTLHSLFPCPGSFFIRGFSNMIKRYLLRLCVFSLLLAATALAALGQSPNTASRNVNGITEI